MNNSKKSFWSLPDLRSQHAGLSQHIYLQSLDIFGKVEALPPEDKLALIVPALQKNLRRTDWQSVRRGTKHRS